MDFAQADRAIRNGVIAGFVSAAMTVLMVTAAMSSGATGRFAQWNDPWNFVDAAVMASAGSTGCGFPRRP